MKHTTITTEKFLGNGVSVEADPKLYNEDLQAG
jgi:hypothetical protein